MIFRNLVLATLLASCFAGEEYVAKTPEELEAEYKAEENPNLFEGDIILTEEQNKVIFGQPQGNVPDENEYIARTPQELEAEYKAEENSNLFEGDIILTEEQRNAIFGKRQKRDGLVNPNRKWPNGVVPYVIHHSFDSYRRKVLKQAISDYNNYTCIKFIPRNGQRDYVEFYIGNGCYSMIGKIGGRQMISIGQGCQYKGTVIHEMMHALGFYHEQSRLDRDNYIKIFWSNIQNGLAYAFRKYSHGEADYYGEPYDLHSVMHYPNYAFSRNRRPTIEAKSDPKLGLGNRRGFTKIDQNQINKMYSCKGTTPVSPSPNTKPPGSCEDKDKRCPYWAKNKYCTTKENAAWMKVNCCKSCNENCSDGNSSCEQWALRGECKKNPRYMLNVCRKSCKVC